MSKAIALRSGEWRIDDLDGGWVLRVRPSYVSWGEFIPRTRRGCLGLGIGAIFSLCVLSIFLPRGSALDASSSPRYAACILLWIVLGTALWWRMSPPPIVAEHRRANSEQRVEVGVANFENADGVFDTARLRTLRLTDAGALPSRFRLVFTGSAIPEAVFIGWPGLTEPIATEIRDCVLGRIDMTWASEQAALGRISPFSPPIV